MLTLNAEDNSYIEGKLDYNGTDGEDKIVIYDVYSLYDKGFYFTWAMKGFGFGELSAGLGENGWSIDNELMGVNTCCKLVRVFEEALIAQNNPQVNYFLAKLKNNIDKNCKSLDQGLTLIWREGVKEYERPNDNKFIEPLVLGELTVTSSVYDELDGNINNNKNIDEAYYFGMDFDYQWQQFGKLMLEKNVKNNIVSFKTSAKLKKETFILVINNIELIDIEKLEEKDKSSALKLKNDWMQFKVKSNLIGSIEEIATEIWENEQNPVKVNEYVVVKG